MTERELILYACPVGPLADNLDTYFSEVAKRFGPTTAQTYPVHCTMTGFFRRRGNRADEAIRHLGEVVERFGSSPPNAVSIDRLGVHDGWVGLELTSAWVLDVIDAVVAADTPMGGEDTLRPKDWLHVSLAYGVDDVAPYADFARVNVDLSLPVAWKVRLWERNMNGSWTEH